MAANPHSFAGRLQALRTQRRLSKTALAKSVGVTTTCVWNWEEGNTEPRAENLFALSKVFNVPTDYLESGKGHTQGNEVTAHSNTVSLPEAIAMAKDQIASLAGIAPDKVKISLDY
jgi:transcriptional regulator with XRE-family HTH domain